MCYDVPAFPLGRDCERLSVGAAVVVYLRDIRRIVPELVLPRVFHIDIGRISVAVEFPDSGNRHFVPSFVVELRSLEALRPSVQVPGPKELPLAVKAKVLVRMRLVAGLGLCLAFVGKVVGVHRGAVDCVHAGILPLVEALGGGSKAQQGKYSADKIAFLDHIVCLLCVITQI